MWWDRSRPWVVFVPPITAASVMLLYFWLTDRWEHLENPIQSQIAMAGAIAGVLAGIAVQRTRNWWRLAVPGLVTAGLFLWMYFMPHETPEDSELRNILAVLTVLAAVTTIGVNLPQFVRGRGRAPGQPAS